MRLRQVLKFFFRAALLAAAILLYFVDIERIDFLTIFQQGIGGIFLWLVWIMLVIEMLLRIIPNRRIAIGARKHYACSYKAVSSTETDASNINVKSENINKGALLSAIAWFAVSAAILSTLFFLDMLSPAVVLVYMLMLAVLDLVFILIFCPFRAFFMRNKCCTVCRIYNWDYIMMCAPMILFPSFYSISLVVLSLTVLLRWEIALRKNPQYFISKTNDNLRCETCVDKGHFKRCRTQKGETQTN
jgi:hypothetical protein